MPRVASETNSSHHAAHGQRRSSNLSQPRSDTSPFASLLDAADSQAATADSPATGRAARLDPSRKSDAPADPRRNDTADNGRDVPANSQANQTGDADPSAAVAKADATSAQTDDTTPETAVQTAEGDDMADTTDQHDLGFIDQPAPMQPPGLRSTPVVPIIPTVDGGSRQILTSGENPAGASSLPETTVEPCVPGDGQDRRQTSLRETAASSLGRGLTGPDADHAASPYGDTVSGAQTASAPADPKTDATPPQQDRDPSQIKTKFESALKGQLDITSGPALKSDAARDDRVDQAPSSATTSSSNPFDNLTVTTANGHVVTGGTATTANSAATTTANAVPVAGIAVEIATQARSGNNRFDIRLDPPELGRIDVRLDVDKHGRVTSHLVVDRVETLDLLRRDSAGLERALQDAGLKTSDNGLNFSLRDQSFNQGAGGQGNWRTAQIAVPDETASPLAFAQDNAQIARLGGIDIRV